jgi:hypothetical protein
MLKFLLYSVIITVCWSCFISFLWQNQKVQRHIDSFKNWVILKIIPFKYFIQILISTTAIIIALYALKKDSVRDSESSKRFSQSVSLEKDQHNEIMKVYAKQNELLLKYNQSADSMLAQQEIQAKIAKLQYENQLILTQPLVTIEFAVHDTLKTAFNYDNENWIMPEVRLKYTNSGGRIANDFKLKLTFVAPNRRTIQEFTEVREPFLCATCTNFTKFYPLIALEDKDFFLLIVDFQYTDELNLNYKPGQRYYVKCIVNKNNSYITGKMDDKQIKYLQGIMNNPSKRIILTDKILEYLRRTYNVK